VAHAADLMMELALNPALSKQDAARRERLLPYVRRALKLDKPRHFPGVSR
jgi:hypothetical protein